jgi:hypothetical protein
MSILFVVCLVCPENGLESLTFWKTWLPQKRYIKCIFYPHSTISKTCLAVPLLWGDLFPYSVLSRANQQKNHNNQHGRMPNKDAMPPMTFLPFRILHMPVFLAEYFH